jgi:hypothetical protein
MSDSASPPNNNEFPVALANGMAVALLLVTATAVPMLNVNGIAVAVTIFEALIKIVGAPVVADIETNAVVAVALLDVTAVAVPMVREIECKAGVASAEAEILVK